VSSSDTHPRDRFNTVSAGGLILSSCGRIAVVSQITDSISLPKGHVNENESTLDAAVREIYEETGLQVSTPLRAFPAYDRASGRRCDETKTIVMFLFLLDDEPQLVPVDPDNPAAYWLSVEDALDNLTYTEDRAFLASAIAEARELPDCASGTEDHQEL